MADVRPVDANELLKESVYCTGPDGSGMYAVPISVIFATPTITPAPHWISVNDRLPNSDEGDDFLAVSKNGGLVSEAYFERDCGHGRNLWSDGSGNFYDVTHWMPLPEPPKKEGDRHE